MKGVLLAGGLGTRLKPCTDVTNKHLLPVYNQPMIYYPLEKLSRMGIDEVLIISGGEHIGDIAEQLRGGHSLQISGREVTLDLTYKVQENPDGIAGALRLAQGYVGDSKFAVILGDNIFQDEFFQYATHFEIDRKHEACIFLKRVSDAHRFGVASISKGKIKRIVEKPKITVPGYAVTGLYFYSPELFDIVRKLKPSKRNELEITDVNNAFAKRGSLDFKILNGEWTDAGTPESLFRAASLVRGVK